MNSNLSGKTENEGTACPHFGAESDPATFLAYPSRWNFCFKSRPKAVPLLDHQVNFCMIANHTECPVFQMEEQATFPSILRFQETRSRKLRPWMWFVPLLVAVGAFVFFLIIPGLNGPGLLKPTQGSATELMGVQTLETLTPIPSIDTPFPQVIQPTNTLIASVTPALETESPSISPHTLDTPIGITHKFVIHRIQEGESLGNLAVQYNTNLQAIQDVNYFLPDPVWVNWLVVIPVETTEVVGLPTFEAQMVVNGDILIEDFAATYNLDPSTLKFYNGLPDGYLLSNGEWLLIPHIID